MWTMRCPTCGHEHEYRYKRDCDQTKLGWDRERAKDIRRVLAARAPQLLTQYDAIFETDLAHKEGR